MFDKKIMNNTSLDSLSLCPDVYFQKQSREETGIQLYNLNFSQVLTYHICMITKVLFIACVTLKAITILCLQSPVRGRDSNQNFPPWVIFKQCGWVCERFLKSLALMIYRCDDDKGSVRTLTGIWRKHPDCLTKR